MSRHEERESGAEERGDEGREAEERRDEAREDLKRAAAKRSAGRRTFFKHAGRLTVVFAALAVVGYVARTIEEEKANQPRPYRNDNPVFFTDPAGSKHVVDPEDVQNCVEELGIAPGVKLVFGGEGAEEIAENERKTRRCLASKKAPGVCDTIIGESRSKYTQNLSDLQPGETGCQGNVFFDGTIHTTVRPTPSPSPTSTP